MIESIDNKHNVYKDNTVEKSSKMDFELFICIAFFSISNGSRLLEMLGVPRILTYVLYVVVMTLYFMVNLRRGKSIDLLYYLIAGTTVLLGVWKNYQYMGSIANIASVIILFIPSYFFFRVVDLRKLLIGFRYSMYFAACYLLFFYFYAVRGNMTYSMSYAYWVAFPIVFLFYEIMHCKGKKKIFLSLIWIFLILTLIISGSRGALGLTIIGLLFIYVFTANQINKTQYRMAFITAVAAVVYVNLSHILAYLGKYSDMSRNIRKIIDGNFVDTSSRDGIYYLCKNYISENPWGYGCLVSRRLLVGHNYPHSIMYELQLDYGKYLGMIICLTLIIIAVYLLWKTRKSPLTIIITPMVIIGFFSLFVSSSLYYDYYVPGIIGLVFRLRMRDKMNDINDLEVIC